ncbi:hypothetical protein F2Q69_00036379 [Brassica cretica]|uniref:Uncharacterized protein n=1 Tax=Brassica cretica TaxID=69181 RepID=A0A8S9SUB7_BRACR|nr:hypothetical protein F2Q69_00036379 [Brassica cretica]
MGCKLELVLAKNLEGEKSVARVKSSSPTGSEGRDRPPKKAKTNGSDHRLGVSGKAAVAKPFHWQFSHSKDCPITEDPDSVALLVRHFKPAGCPLPFFGNMTEREAYVKMVVAHAKAMEANNEFAATLEKRLWPLLRLRTKEVEHGSELDVMAVSYFSVGKLDLPQISEDLPEDFFARDPSSANGTVDVTKCSGGQFEDGEFGIEE